MKKVYICIFMIMSALLYSSELDYSKSLKQFADTSIASELKVFQEVLLKYEPLYDNYFNQLNEDDKNKLILMGVTLFWKQLHSSDISPDNMNVLLDIIVRIKFRTQQYAKLTDRFLFDFIMQLYTSENLYLSCCGLSNINFFSDTLIEENVYKIFAPFEKKQRISCYEITKIPLSDSTKKEYNALLKKMILKVKQEISSLDKNGNDVKDMIRKINRLYFCAYLGDQESKKDLIDIFSKLHFTDDSAVFKFVVDLLLKLNTKDAGIAVLSRFHENVGAPNFYTGDSPRYYILSELYKRYPNDDFFRQYKNYLEASSIFSSPPYPEDDYLGGEEGVRKLFAAFQEWAQKRFQYDLQLKNSIPKINSKNRARKYKMLPGN
ncbi:MAG: hypothetical protein V8T90_16895 [Victivallales bacterium]